MSDFDLQGLAQVSVSTDIPAHRRIVDGAISEITTLRQQLAESQARAAELKKAGRMLSFSEWKKHLEREDVQECGHVVYRSPAEKSLLYAKYRQSCEQNLDSLLLRKQAEAVEQAKYEHALTARIPDGTAGEHFQDGFDTAAEQYDASLDRYAQRLRQQADEAERAGGEK